MTQAKTRAKQGNWTEALDLRIQTRVWFSIPQGKRARLYDDALQEGRLRVLQAEPGHDDAHYLRLAGCGARNYVQRERRRFGTESGRALPLLNDGTPASPDEVVRDDRPEPAVDANTLRRSLRALLNTIVTPQERQVLELRYGLQNGGQARTLGEVGEACGVSRETVRTLEMKALKKLRHVLRSHDFDGLPDSLASEENARGPGE